MEIKSGLFDIRHVYENCTVEVLENSITGECSVGWWRNECPPMGYAGEALDDEDDDCRTLSD